MNLFRVTYETVSPESAEDGECIAAGYALTGGWLIDTYNDPDMDTAGVDMDLRSALSITGESLTWTGGWFNADQYDEDYGTGETTSYCLHPPRTITPSSLRRLRRLLNA